MTADATDTAGTGRALRWGLVALAFLLSGGAALVYQVVWQRILMLHTGIGVTSVALIVAAFMAGLGLGSHLGGTLSARVSPAQALRLFALVEVAIGIFAAVSCRLYYEGFGTWAASLYRTTAGMAVAHLLAFLVPTTLMGLSLPLLVRATVREVATASRVIGRLYGVNVLGAAIGAIIAPWALVRFFGMEGAVRFGVAANLLAAAGALAAGWRGRSGARPGTGAEASPAPGVAAPPPDAGAHQLGLWMGLYGLSGFLALSLEITWFRLIDVGVKSTAFTFGTVLSLYLLGLGAGSLAGGRLSTRLRHPLQAFLDFQLLLLAYSAAALALLAFAPPTAPVYRWFLDYWRQDPFFQLGADWDAGALLRLYLLLPAFVYGPPTFLMGLSFGALQRAVQDDPRTSGRKVGFLQAANIAGCTAGSLVTGLVLLEGLGSAGTLRLLAAGGGAVFLLVRARSSGLDRAFAVRAVALGLAVLVLPSSADLWQRLHGVTAASPPSFIGEDASAVSVVIPGGPGRWRIRVNGLPHSWLPYEGIHTLLGAVPVLMHPDPVDVVVIGLGSGESAWAAACRPETRRLRVYEIAASQPRLLRAVADFTPLPDLRRLLEDPRVTMAAADGRQALQRSDERYDVIQIDAVHRTSAGSGNLYSLEFFRLCASRLKPGGLVCSQKPARRVGLTFAAAVPYALDLGNIVVGSNDPLPMDVAAWAARLRRPEVWGYFPSGVAEGILERLGDARPAPVNPTTRLGLNRDLYPRDEFSTPAGRPD